MIHRLKGGVSVEKTSYQILILASDVETSLRTLTALLYHRTMCQVITLMRKRSVIVRPALVYLVTEKLETRIHVVLIIDQR